MGYLSGMITSSYVNFVSGLLFTVVLVSLSAAESKTKPVIFKVSDCELSDVPLKTRPAKIALGEVLGGDLEAFSPEADEDWIERKFELKHPFLLAAHLSFAEHRPLALSPDMIWQLLIMQASVEVNADPEKYRELFATHERGARTLSVRRDQFHLGDPSNDWPGVFAELEGQIIKNVPDSPARLFAHAFSTSSPTDIAARHVLLLNAASDFYSYYLGTFCGIPQIELHGTTDDWIWLRDKASELKHFNMERRIKALQPVLDEFILASQGKANPEFWKSFYKYGSESGGAHVSGWINLFFVTEADKKLDVVLEPDFLWTTPVEKSKFGPTHLALALHTTHFDTTGLVEVEFVWNHLGKTYPMLIRAGFMGVEQDPKSLTLKPSTAWQVIRVKLSLDERKAVDYLSELKHIHQAFNRSLYYDFVLDSESGNINLAIGEGNGILDSRFWRKAFPLMHRLKSINAPQIIGNNHNDEEKQATCEAMLSAKSVTVVYVSEDFDKECLKILQTRRDWEIKVIEKEKD